MTSARLGATASLSKPPSGDETVENAARVVLIDPRPDRRAVMNFLVQRCPTLTVVGLAANLDEAQAQIQAENADIALVEIQMPVPEGLATIGGLRTQFPDLKIIVCSFHLDPATREAAKELGANGYLIKPVSIRDMSALVS